MRRPNLKSKPINVLITEDEIPASNLIGSYVEKIPELNLLEYAYSGRKTLEHLRNEKIDLLILDVNLPDMNGLKVLDELERLNLPKPQTIITTSHNEYALHGFELGVCDYLPKPFSFERFQKAAQRAIVKIRESRSFANETGNLHFRFKGDQVIMPYKQIIYLASQGKSTNIFTATGSYSPSVLLKDIYEQLPKDLFYRLHKQYIVNLKFISHIRYDAGGRYLAYVKNEQKDILPVGVIFAAGLRERLNLNKPAEIPHV
jgi:DNA-binding LytR/AlgR family response regulator